jgi:5'-nucleotidase
MTGRTILTLSNGKGIDLLAPKAEDIDFAVIAEHLAKENRYNGATANLCYSVAEHSLRCADAALLATGNRTLAAYLLLHDAHEAFLKDDTTPKKRAIAAVAQESFGLLADTVIRSFDLLTFRIDQAVHRAAGLQWAPYSALQTQIKHWDLTLFVTEWRDLMGNQPHPDWTPYRDIKPLEAKICPLDWRDARNAFLDGCYELLPALQREALR